MDAGPEPPSLLTGSRECKGRRPDGIGPTTAPRGRRLPENGAAMNMVDLFAILASLVIGVLGGYLFGLSRRAATAREAAELQAQLAALNATLKAERAAHEEKLALLDDARDQMTHQFRALANDILEEKSRRFTEQNQTNLGQLLDPLK